MGVNGETRIRFLGTGASDWMPPHECNEVCRERCAKIRKWGGRNIRRACSLFIPPDTLIDFTSQTAEALDAFGIERPSIRHLVITHGHSDHFQPLEILRFAADLPHTLAVYGNATVRDALEFAAAHRWGPAHGLVTVQDAPNVEVSVLRPGSTAVIGDARFTALLANHMIDRRHMILEQQALNYVVELKGSAIFYGLDSSFVLPSTFKQLSKWRFDAVILDATFGDLEIDPRVSGHQNFAMLEQTIAQFRQAGLVKDNATIVASHVSRRYVDPHDQIADDLAARGITLAYDGMMVDL